MNIALLTVRRLLLRGGSDYSVRYWYGPIESCYYAVAISARVRLRLNGGRTNMDRLVMGTVLYVNEYLPVLAESLWFVE